MPCVDLSASRIARISGMESSGVDRSPAVTSALVTDTTAQRSWPKGFRPSRYRWVVAPELDPPIAAHYRHDPERDRLETWALLEGVRTREMLSRFLPPPPAVVLDVGGAQRSLRIAACARWVRGPPHRPLEAAY